MQEDMALEIHKKKYRREQAREMVFHIVAAVFPCSSSGRGPRIEPGEIGFSLFFVLVSLAKPNRKRGVEEGK